MKNIIVSKVKFDDRDYEFVERKGSGHPDTLADGLAEELSREYSKYTLEKFGAVLHHNFDKVGLLGGASLVTFGEGRLTKPIRVLLNGRASYKFANEFIPVDDLLKKWSVKYLKDRFPSIDPESDLEFHMNLSTQSSPGKTDEDESKKGTRRHWFEPRSLDDIQETTKLLSNDTSLGVGYAPLSKLESLILKIESALNSDEYKKDKPWLGSDIKILGFRYKDEFKITMCIPQIANYVKSLDEYKVNLESVKNDILRIAGDGGVAKLELNTNTRDNYELCEIYMTAIGSSIESGDEGLVGRGNRINGLISPNRPMSMEGACGKNPVYHIGKVYYVTAMKIAQKIHDKFGIYCEVFLASQSGRDLLDPWITLIAVPENMADTEGVREIANSELLELKKISKDIMGAKHRLY